MFEINQVSVLKEQEANHVYRHKASCFQPWAGRPYFAFKIGKITITVIARDGYAALVLVSWLVFH